MGKYKTKAIQAAEQINKLLNDNKNIYRPWGLVSKYLENRTLDCIAEEAEIIFKNNSNVRPGFDVNEKTAYVPNLFIKFSGTDDSSKYFYMLLDQRPSKNTFIYDNYKGFCSTELPSYDVTEFLNEDKVLDKESLLLSDLFPYSFLKREYQHLIIDKIDEILVNQTQYFNKRLATVPKRVILSYLLGIDLNLITAFNEFDFALKPPAIIINNSKRIRIKSRQAAVLMLLNLLGFDIIVLSGKGYSDIENEIHPDVYSIFYGERMAASRRLNHRGKILIASAAVVIITAASILLPGMLKDNKTTPDETDNDPAGIVEDITSPGEDNIEVQTDDAEVPKDDSDTETTVTEAMVITKTKSSSEVSELCEIRIFINDPKGRPLDISKASVAIQNGDLYESVDELTQRHHSNINGGEMRLTRPYRNFTIYLSKEYADINYVISQDFNDYGYFINGTIPLGDYSEYDLIEIVYNIGEFNNKEITITDYPGSDNPIYYSLITTEMSIDKPRYGFANCKGEFHTDTKVLYTNTDLCELRLSGSLDNAIFLTSDSLSFEDNDPANISLDFIDYKQYSISVNPELSAYSYFRLTDIESYFRYEFWGVLPTESEFSLYLNKSISSYYLTLSRTGLFKTDNSINDIYIRDNIKIGYDAYISDISTFLNYQGGIGLNAYLTDNDQNIYRNHGYGYEDKRLDPYAMKLEYFKDNELILTELYNIQYDTIEEKLENGRYMVMASPARDNEIYKMTSIFELTVDDSTNSIYKYDFIGYD